LKWLKIVTIVKTVKLVNIVQVSKPGDEVQKISDEKLGLPQ
jgi:hypothetical protein